MRTALAAIGLTLAATAAQAQEDTITIRAGHRLRIWFTSDVLVPRPTQGD